MQHFPRAAIAGVVWTFRGEYSELFEAIAQSCFMVCKNFKSNTFTGHYPENDAFKLLLVSFGCTTQNMLLDLQQT